MNNLPNLLSPFTLGTYTLKNRLVMAPLTRNRAQAGNIPGQMNVVYYTQRATAGLIISEGSQISPQGVGYPLTPGIHSPAQIAGWQMVTKAVHEHGGLIFLQLWHCGRISHPSFQENGALPVAPSAITPAGETMTYEGLKPFVAPRALETSEISDVIQQYAQAAKNALDAGFDGVEIHGANGYLIDQFLRDGTNQRTDEYGGSIENRSRFLLEVTEAVVKVWGAKKVGVRLSPGGTFNDMKDSNSINTFSYAVNALNRFDLAYLHIKEADEKDLKYGGEYIPATLFRPIFKGVLMVNDNYDAQEAEDIIANNGADLVAFGKLYIANPDLPQRFKLNAPLNEPDFDTFYGGGEKGYIDYPTLEG